MYMQELLYMNYPGAVSTASGGAVGTGSTGSISIKRETYLMEIR